MRTVRAGVAESLPTPAMATTRDLIFVDTNILLDFYRVRRESGLTLLKALDGLHEDLITTYQVEMEFKKNRQAAISESLRNLKDRDSVGHPAFIAESASANIVNRNIKDANSRLARFRAKLAKVLANPTTHDPVYTVVQRMFVDKTDLNLTRDRMERREVKRKAFRRFMLGYPPRKAGDTSMGDALNWEWIVHLALKTGRNVTIVSRDSDYGVEVERVVYPNDWLLQEFRDRVSKQRKLRLFNRLAPALKLHSVHVTKEAEQEERAVVERQGLATAVLDLPGDKWWANDYAAVLESLNTRRRLNWLGSSSEATPPSEPAKED